MKIDFGEAFRTYHATLLRSGIRLNANKKKTWCKSSKFESTKLKNECSHYFLFFSDLLLMKNERKSPIVLCMLFLPRRL